MGLWAVVYDVHYVNVLQNVAMYVCEPEIGLVSEVKCQSETFCIIAIWSKIFF